MIGLAVLAVLFISAIVVYAAVNWMLSRATAAFRHWQVRREHRNIRATDDLRASLRSAQHP
jgi:hypothetical protein